MIAKFLVALLVAYLGWRLWRGPVRAAERAAAPRADVTDARALLGVAGDAGAGEIRAAHRRLVADVHPDRGGSTEETRRLNAARDLLLGQPGVANGGAV